MQPSCPCAPLPLLSLTDLPLNLRLLLPISQSLAPLYLAFSCIVTLPPLPFQCMDPEVLTKERERAFCCVSLVRRFFSFHAFLPRLMATDRRSPSRLPPLSFGDRVVLIPRSACVRDHRRERQRDGGCDDVSCERKESTVCPLLIDSLRLSSCCYPYLPPLSHHFFRLCSRVSLSSPLIHLLFRSCLLFLACVTRSLLLQTTMPLVTRPSAEVTCST